jgi:hypothetical protein
MSIKIGNNIVLVMYDPMGNIFLKKNDMYYTFSVGDEINLTRINNLEMLREMMEENIELNNRMEKKLIKKSNQNSLKGKIIKHLKENDGDDIFDHDYVAFDDSVIEKNYYDIESLSQDDQMDSDSDSELFMNENRFIFCFSSENKSGMMTPSDIMFPTYATHDTIFIDGCVGSKKICSTVENNGKYYPRTIIIYSDGTINMNINGKCTFYSLGEQNDGELELLSKL